MGSWAVRGVLAALALASGGAEAQTGNPRLPPGAIVQSLDEGPGGELRRNLTTLANNPRSLEALMGAGRAAVAMGDGEAALSFFARADEVDGRNARVKAGMGSALVLLERGNEALGQFRQAEALGAQAADLARDRGLAYDMTGDPARAQQDYELALRRREDPEVRRRLALSLAISGERDAALAAIAGQLRNQERSAWRTQAFVLALTGDTRGASQTASRMMPGAGEQMAPFFARLAALSPAQKARAVHFGTFPRDGRPDRSAVTLARNDPVLPAIERSRPAEPLPEVVERRRPGPSSSGIRERTDLGRRPDRDPALSGPIAPPVQLPVRTVEAEPRRFEPAPEASPAQAEPIRITENAAIGPGFSLTPGGGQPEPEPSPIIAAPAAERAASTGLADIASVIATLPADEARPPAPAPARSTQRTPAREIARRLAPQPARRWVQLATVERAALGREFSRLRGNAPDVLRNRSAYAAAFGRSSRLLIGPFDTNAQAQALVTQLSRERVSAFAWTSEAGQEIERVQTANAARSTPNRAQPQQRQARASPQRPTAATRTSRGRAEPEPRTPTRRRRTN